MRLTHLLPWLGLTAPIIAKSTTTDDDTSDPTIFNGVEVPPFPELRGERLMDTVKSGTWFVEFFSPYCHHCKQQAPILQTAYEFYYTSDPLGASSTADPDGLNSFTKYYDFHFAKIDCVAFGTACQDMKIDSFPTLVLFKGGEEVDRKVGTQSLKQLSGWIEEVLESIKPGSRSVEGPVLPKVGAKEAPEQKKSASKGGKESKAQDVEKGKEMVEKHNSLAASATGIGATKSKTGSLKAGQTANPDGKSIHLTADSFQRLVTTTRDPWFIKFYAPWCGHCQQMAPGWASMAREMRGTLNVGEVNCDVEKRLCKDAKVKGYPTMFFFRGGERVEYEGLRGVGDLTSFAKKAVDVGMGVEDVDKARFEKLEETEEVIFVYFYDHATTSEDFLALDRLTLSLVGHAKLVKSKDPELWKRFKISTWPRLMVSRSGKPSYYAPLAPKDMRDTRKVLGWMKGVWQPIVPELTASNAHEVMDGKVVVLGILSKERKSEFEAAKKELKNAALEWMDREANAIKLERQELRDAKQLRIEEAEDRSDSNALRKAKAIRINMSEIERADVRFMWIDGAFWERWLRTTFGVDVRTDGERVVIYDESTRRYWDLTSTGNPIVPSRTSILETLPKTLKNPPVLTPKSTHSSVFWFFWKVRNTWNRHPWLTGFGLVIMSAAAVVLGRRARRRGGGGGGGGMLGGGQSIWLDEKGNAFGGILGVDQGTGKTD